MTLTILCAISLVTAAIPGILFCWNLCLYREPAAASGGTVATHRISVLIPARNEEASIAGAVESVLCSTGVALEVIVLDDASTDRTAAIVGNICARDARVRLEFAPPLPSGWNGKQHACYLLSKLARQDLFCFLDADVRLAPETLGRMASFMMASDSDLVSGFPFQETESTLEWLLLPLIHFILLGFLPVAAMRQFRSSSLAAGCGQFMMGRCAGYRLSGGHSEIRATMHDGLLLPKLFREHGLRTDLADLTRLATCRMYHSAAEVWSGLTKNATEGLAAPMRILPFSFLLFFGQVLPLFLFALAFAKTGLHSSASMLALGAVVASFLPRLLAVLRFRQRLESAVLHPMGVLVLLTLEWYSLGRKLTGRQATWKQRAYDVG